MKTLYPTGRKHCSSCKRWRLIIDFGPRTWKDEPHCTVIHTVLSHCEICVTTRSRTRNGHKPRRWYPNGAPGSKKHTEARKRHNRDSMHRRMRKKQYREKINEYSRIWYNAKRAVVYEE